jgi:hypothetical protein
MFNEYAEGTAVPGFLDQQSYSSIYYAVETTMNENADQGKDLYAAPFYTAENSPFIMYSHNFDEYLYDAVKEDIEGSFDYTVSKPEIMFAKLNKKISESDNPLPRFDNISRKNEAVLVVQLDSTISWQLKLAGRKTYTERNMGMFFTNPYGVAWDLKDDFTDNDYFDLLVCRVSILD